MNNRHQNESLKEQNKFWNFINNNGFWWNQDNNTLGEDEWTIVWKWIVSFCKRKVNKALTSRDNEWRERIKTKKIKYTGDSLMGIKIACGESNLPLFVNDDQIIAYNKALDDLLEQMEDK